MVARALHLCFGFNAFGDHSEVRLPGERYHRGGDRPVILVLRRSVDKGLVDLEPRYRERPQRAQARIAGAEIVDR